MKRVGQVLAALCVLALVVTLCGCGGSGEVGGLASDGVAKKPAPPPPPPPTSTPSKIAFDRYMGSRGSLRGTWQVFTVNTDGTGEQRLTSTDINTRPSWAPDGRLAFTSNRDGQRRIYTMNSDGSGQTAITSPPSGNPGDDAPDWCLGDAGKIVFVRNRNGTAQYSDLWMVEGGTETQLTDSPLRDSWPSFSPDGQFVLLNRIDTEGVTGQLCVVPVAGGGALPLQWGATAVQGTYPDWSPDGTSIVYYYYAEIWRLPVNPETGEATGPPEQLTSDGTAPYQYHPTWSPLQDYVAYWTNPGGRVVTRELATGVVTDLASGEYPDWSPAVFGN